LLSLIIWRSRYLAWATNMHSSPVGMITKLWWVETDEANALAERIDGACVHDKISERLIGSAATATLVAATKNPRRISFCSDISQMQGYVALRMEVLSIVDEVVGRRFRHQRDGQQRFFHRNIGGNGLGATRREIPLGRRALASRQPRIPQSRWFST
jgi:hypothetical protein